jgi:hypothetical protein
VAIAREVLARGEVGRQTKCLAPLCLVWKPLRDASIGEIAHGVAPMV